MNEIVKFGFWAMNVDFKVSSVSIRPLPGYDGIIEAVAASRGTYEGWIYAPNVQQTDFVSGRTSELPVPGRVFGLPKTHEMEIDAGQPPGLSRFAIWCLGFFSGMRLTETDMGFLDATPIQPGKLCDFLCTVGELPRAMQPALDFYRSHQGNEISETLLAAIHALWLSEAPHLLRFERYHYAYIAIDALWFVTTRTVSSPPGRTPHAERIDALARLLGLHLPLWPDLIKERNNAIHQGLFYGQPLGFFSDTSVNSNVIVEMQAFICRAVVQLLGVDAAPYIISPCTSYQRHGLF